MTSQISKNKKSFAAAAAGSSGSSDSTVADTAMPTLHALQKGTLIGSDQQVDTINLYGLGDISPELVAALKTEIAPAYGPIMVSTKKGPITLKVAWGSDQYDAVKAFIDSWSSKQHEPKIPTMKGNVGDKDVEYLDIRTMNDGQLYAALLDALVKAVPPTYSDITFTTKNGDGKIQSGWSVDQFDRVQEFLAQWNSIDRSMVTEGTKNTGSKVLFLNVYKMFGGAFPPGFLQGLGKFCPADLHNVRLGEKTIASTWSVEKYSDVQKYIETYKKMTK